MVEAGVTKDDVLARIEDAPTQFLFWCPGCECSHHLETGKDQRVHWEWNGSMVKPTASPSLLIRGGGKPKDYRCHLHIREGALKFCSDSSHALAGETVPMVPWATAGD